VLNHSVTEQFTVLFVCQANLCRSPMAERLARRRLPAGALAHSAGTRALEGSPVHPGAAEVLRERGADAAGFVSRQVTEALLLGADLVLTATRHQRAVCVSLAPEAVRHTFTLRQYARMVAATSPAHASVGAYSTVESGPQPIDLRERLRLAVAGRSRLQPVAPEDDDLSDPVREPLEAFRRCADVIDAALDHIIGR
jgi:protein-tyrosine phosphatase